MNIKLLIDNVMRQTTVLIAQLSTAAGVRAPLAHIADQVFLSLAREIEAQGVGRKVVADMFGMALRGYQVKTQRLAESHSRQGKTLFEAVLGYIEQHGTVTRRALLQRFRSDGDRQTIGVVSDLVGSGLIHATGRGATTVYGRTSDAERQRLTRETDELALADMLWGEVYRGPLASSDALAAHFRLPVEQIDAALQHLFDDGRVKREPDGRLRTKGFLIPVDAERGWESAVFDHFQAVAAAIASKLALMGAGDPRADHVGGTTLRFQLTEQHPYQHQVLSLLDETRQRLNRLWNEVAEHNDAHGVDERSRFDVVFYFGQNIDRRDPGGETTKE